MSYDHERSSNRLYQVGAQYPLNSIASIKGYTSDGSLNGTCTPAPGLFFSDPWQQNKPLMTINCDAPQSNPQRRMALVLVDSAEELEEQLCADTLRKVMHHQDERHRIDQPEMVRHMKRDICSLSSTYEEEKDAGIATSRNNTDASHDPWKGLPQQTDHQELPFEGWPSCEPVFYQSHCHSSRKRKFDNTDSNEHQGTWRHRSK